MEIAIIFVLAAPVTLHINNDNGTEILELLFNSFTDFVLKIDEILKTIRR